MTSTGWVHLGILVMVFAGVAVFAFRRMVLPKPREGSIESLGGGSTWAGGADGSHSADGGGHSGGF
ncbi:hypothetical protein [Mesorhizobium sp.]|uniref:hypothetical protein n=1 Tax=Mesorhizobium sp. TaxID=1871066 RepID=UPI000FE97A1D|nr:hypothetical protein [Mesorhizobium sp.]RWA67661.1 MAG: hypothetical protein EOQ29_22645 [Mesorhizobium sp.]RWA84983.1 MAG: hypothetical protein EOQ30_06245 [Mesorhizobium sp.]